MCRWLSSGRVFTARGSRASRRPLLLAGILLLGVAPSLAAQPLPATDGERAWAAGHEAALRGRADSALTAFREALRLSQQDRDQELASAARLGMAEVFDVWYRCVDSARVAYEDAVRLTSEGDYAAADAYVLWLARRGQQAEARALHARTYQPIENSVPRSVTRESVNFLLGLAAIQISNSSRSGALSSLISARDIANRLTVGDVEEAVAANGGVTTANYWALHDLAELQLDARSGSVRNVGAGRALRTKLDAATVSDNGGHPRFSVGRLADRVARQRRVCAGGRCAAPPPPPTRARCP